MLLDFQKKIADVQGSIALLEPDDDNEKLMSDLKNVAQQSLEIYQALAKKAGLGD